MAVSNFLAIKTISEQFLDLLPDILAFYTCWELDSILLTTNRISLMATDKLCNNPPRQIFSLSLTINKEVVKCFVQKSMEDPKEQIDTNRFLKSFGYDKNIRSQSTEIAFKFDCNAMQQFKESYLEISHLWKDQHLTIVINPCVNKKDIIFFQKMFLFESGLTQEANSLLIKDNTDSYPYLNPFEHGDLRECKNLTIHAPDAVFDSQEVVAFLHDNDKSTSEYTTEKELCFAFREDNEQYDVVYGLIRQLVQRFISDGRARTYTLTLLNCYGDLAIGYGCGGATTLHSNDKTKERLQAQRSIFTDKRQQMHMPARPEKASVFDIKIMRAYKPASMVVKVEK